jgi:hypothetical protein
MLTVTSCAKVAIRDEALRAPDFGPDAWLPRGGEIIPLISVRWAGTKDSSKLLRGEAAAPRTFNISTPFSDTSDGARLDSESAQTVTLKEAA